MRCEDWREQMEADLDGELPDTERARYREHLETCADCRAALAARKRLRAEVRAELSGGAPADLRAAILQSGAQAESAPRGLGDLLGWLRARPLLHHGLAGAAAVIAILFAYWIGGRPDLNRGPASRAVVVLRYGEMESTGHAPTVGALELGGCF